MTRDPASSTPNSSDTSHGFESLLWLAAGAAWALVVLRAWNQTRRLEAKRKMISISDDILKQVFPHGIRRQ